MKNNIKTVFVGVSGGVDSSVSAALLKEATPKNFQKFFGRPTPEGFSGYNVVGVFIRTWQPDFIKCTWRDERRDAMRVCAHLDIPFLECDGEEAYKKGVADYMISEYKLGRTPNPDVICNREVKFGVFWNFAKSHGADFIATGHYAQSSHRSDLWELKKEKRHIGPTYGKSSMLKKGIDGTKDQSYFLWTLNADDLDHTLFPIGHLPKSEVRKLAEKYKLPTATKKDSQGVCFLGPLDMKDFLSHYIEPKSGDVLNEKGEVIGFHDGAVFFTLGERHGFHITEKGTTDTPYYVISKDIDKNTICVSPKQGLGLENFVDNNEYILINSNLLKDFIDISKKYTAQIRYHGEFLGCRVDFDDNKPKIIFDKPALVSAGQSIVVYDDEICLGGGIVK